MKKLKIYACSECFKDEGLKTDAKLIGIHNSLVCPVCGSIHGSKLSKPLLERLYSRFFVRGTIYKSFFGGAPQLEYNEYHYKKSDVKLTPELDLDSSLIESVIKKGLFYYAPRMFMVGENSLLKRFQNKKAQRKTIKEVIRRGKSVEIGSGENFYRIRLNPEKPNNVLEYDSPPDEGKGRLDSSDCPVLYCSKDLELCLHECRVSVDDEIYLATLQPCKKLRVLDLSSFSTNDTVDEFESSNMAIHYLFMASSHSYPICRVLSKSAFDGGFDGIIYPSSFSYIKMGSIPYDTDYTAEIKEIKGNKLNQDTRYNVIPNVAIFGHPIQESKMRVNCINRVLLNKIKYDVSFGPVIE